MLATELQPLLESDRLYRLADRLRLWQFMQPRPLYGCPDTNLAREIEDLARDAEEAEEQSHADLLHTLGYHAG